MTTLAEPSTSTPSKAALWTGRVLSAVVVLFMAMGGVMNLLGNKQAVEEMAKRGYPSSAVTVIGVLALAAAILYAVPQTAVLGAIVLTAYFGGAVDAHVRAGESNWWVAVLFGVVTWLAIYLRDARVRAIVPLR
jgi:hypothetical protein